MTSAVYAPVVAAPPSYIIEMEQAVLWHLIYHSGVRTIIEATLTPECFSLPMHRHIAEAAFEMGNKQPNYDILMLTNAMTQNPQAAQYVCELRMGYMAHLHEILYSLIEYAIRRDLEALSQATIEQASDPAAQAEETVEAYQDGIYHIAMRYIKPQDGKIDRLIQESIKRLEDGTMPDVIPSGFAEIDEICGGGFALSDLVIIAARPATGKSAFAMAVAKNMASNGIPVAVFSLEMSANQLVYRLMAAESGVDLQRIVRGQQSPAETAILSRIGSLYDMPLIIDDAPELFVFSLFSRVRRMVAEFGVKVIVIDYLQLLQAGAVAAKNAPREQQISAITRTLKAIAKKLNVLVIALSQLSRAMEKRGSDKRPQLSDLRESGAIEQDADGVIFLYRPELHGLTEDEEGNPTKNLVEVIIAKQRHAGVGTVKMRFDAPIMRFSRWWQ